MIRDAKIVITIKISIPTKCKRGKLTKILKAEAIRGWNFTLSK